MVWGALLGGFTIGVRVSLLWQHTCKYTTVVYADGAEAYRSIDDVYDYAGTDGRKDDTVA